MPGKFRDTLFLRAFTFFKIPLLYYVSPVVEKMDDDLCVVRIPLRRRTKNHMNAMYFAVLAAGADCAGGFMAMRLLQKAGGGASLLFKDFKAEFLKRAEGDVFFTCREGASIRAAVEEAMRTGGRIHLPVHVTATVPSKLGAEPVAEFELTLSLKGRQPPSYPL
jgi:acyl-coenzyme A thioesterase PaaI-like protein